MKVMFDALCRAVERNESLSGLRPFLSKARLFHLDIVPHDFLGKALDEIKVEDHVEDFFLPFPVVAIEDRASVMLVVDKEENQRGVKGDRLFFEYMDSQSDRNLAFCDGKTIDENQMKKMKDDGVATIIMSVVDDFHVYRDAAGQLRFDIHGVAARSWLLENEQVKAVYEPNKFSEEENIRLSSSALKNCSACLQEILYVNNPSRFILEKRPIKLRSGHGKNGHIPRTNERSVYTLLEPNKIREILGLPEPREGGPRRPHEVRRHFRSYRSDRWVNVKGKRIVIEAFWVGPSEVDVGAHHYRVLLDK